MSTTNEQILKITRSWIGTPYHHQASVKRVGCDCLGLVRGVWRELYGNEPEAPGNYSPSWGDLDSAERLLAAATRHFNKVDTMVPGNLLIFYVRKARSAKHCAILSSSTTLIHAYSGKSVVETSVGYWKYRIAAIFSFPVRIV